MANVVARNSNHAVLRTSGYKPAPNVPRIVTDANRPPMGAPAEVDVDLLRVGDTWIQQGFEIVYKLTEAEYNFQPYPGAEPYHKFTWQPLNERYSVGNTAPPESVAYQAVSYSINNVTWTWLPVPEWFMGDHYTRIVEISDPQYFICKSCSTDDTGIYTYTWREEGGAGDVSNKMDLAPLNPTAAQIETMPNGQLYSDTVNHKGVVKTGSNTKQEFYDAEISPRVFEINDGSSPPEIIYSPNKAYKPGDIWINFSVQSGERICTALYICKSTWMITTSSWAYRWLCLYGSNSEYYTKTEIDSMIGDVESLLSEV